jgi:hypothetical protein
MSKPLLVRIPQELHARVKEESQRTGVPMGRIVEEALEIRLAAKKIFISEGHDLPAGSVHGLLSGPWTMHVWVPEDDVELPDS